MTYRDGLSVRPGRAVLKETSPAITVGPPCTFAGAVQLPTGSPVAAVGLGEKTRAAGKLNPNRILAHNVAERRAVVERIGHLPRAHLFQSVGLRRPSELSRPRRCARRFAFVGREASADIQKLTVCATSEASAGCFRAISREVAAQPVRSGATNVAVTRADL